MLNEPTQGPKETASGRKGMASTQHPEVTKNIIKILKNGGNAVDAIITSSLLQCIVQPHMSCYSGTIDFLYWDESGKPYYMNAVAELPEGLPPFKPNPHTNLVAAIPGFMPGIHALSEKFGTLKWSEYVKPAIEASEKGVIMTSFMYGALSDSRTNYYFPSSRKFYFPHGFLTPVGQKWIMPETAKILRKSLQDGPEYFTKGEWAKDFVKKSNEIGWKISLEHMASYEPRWLKPLRFKYNGYEVLGNPPPQMGGLTVAHFLGVLEEFDLVKMGHYSMSADTLHLMAHMFYRIWSELDQYIQDPLSYKVPSSVYLSKSYQKSVAKILRESEPKIDLSKHVRLNTNPSLNHAMDVKLQNEVNSCHNCIVDDFGNWVSMMHTGNGGGIPGVIVKGIPGHGGSNNALCIGPGRRIRSHINPIIVMKNDEPCMALGSPGDVAHNVPTVLLNILGFNMTPEEAIDAPRFHPTARPVGVLGQGGVVSVQGGRERWTLDIENRIPNNLVLDLLKKGVEVRPLGDYNWHLGSMQIVWFDKNNQIYKGATDPRRLGYCEGY
jgi:gamma-glutamyltranspeptidase/glutathione hydrolase